MTRLNQQQLRLIIEGLQQADGGTARSQAQRRCISTSSVAFRDALMQVCVHAGYSAFFRINTRAGSERGVNALPTSCDSWCVQYSLATSQLLDAADVRYGGKRAAA